MNEDQVRALVRDLIAAHIGRPAGAPDPVRPPWKTHASHLRLAVQSGQQADGPCFIEPGVGCTHCGFCQSFGH